MGSSTRPGYLHIAVFILALALVSYLLRIVVPMGKEVRLFVYFLNFPTIAYLPQYLGFFVLGVMAYRQDWLRDLSGATGLAGLAGAIVAGVLLFPPAISGQWLVLDFADPLRFLGNGSWESAVYALWDSTTAVGLSLGAIVLFRRFFDGDGGFGRFLSRYSYAVNVIHSPIIVFFAYAMRDIDLQVLLKFALAAVVVIPTCFAAAYVIRRLPSASKVL